MLKPTVVELGRRRSLLSSVVGTPSSQARLEYTAGLRSAWGGTVGWGRKMHVGKNTATPVSHLPGGVLVLAPKVVSHALLPVPRGCKLLHRKLGRVHDRIGRGLEQPVPAPTVVPVVVAIFVRFGGGCCRRC